MRYFTFEYSDEKVFKKAIIISVIVFLMVSLFLFINDITYKNEALPAKIIFSAMFGLISSIILFLILTKNVKKIATAQMNNDFLLLQLDSMTKGIYFEDIESYEVKIDKSISSMTLNLKRKSKFQLFCRNLFCKNQEFLNLIHASIEKIEISDTNNI